MLTQTERKASMSQHPFTAFIDLIQLDQKIRTAHDDISRLKQNIQDVLSQKQEFVTRLEQFKQHVKELKKSIDSYELEIKVLDAKEKKKRAQFEQATNIKEYQPLKREIDQLKHAQNEVEANLMSVWNKYELAQKELEEQQQVFDQKMQEFNTTIDQYQNSIQQLQQQLDTLHKDRPLKEVGVPSEWLDKYTHMRMQVSDPVVPVLRGGCSACFYTITQQELLRLKRKALVQCKGCFRLLYMQEAMDMPEEK